MENRLRATEMKGTSSINKSIVKVLSVFTSLQVVNVICGMVKMKFVSIWLEASGVGLFGIFQQVTDTTATLTDFGLRQSTTREVAMKRNDGRLLGRLLGTIRSWNLLVGIFGGVLLTFLSPLLSSLFFESSAFWWSFVLLGVCILFNAMTAGENSILQGLSRFKELARAGLIASLTGLAVSIPLFRFLGNNSVIFSLLAYAVAAWISIRRFRPRDIEAESPSPALLKEGKDFAKLGGYMALAAFISSLALTIFIWWLNHYASTSEVGYYQAGNTLVVRYMGFVLSAIGLEFYPRIAACGDSSMRRSVYVSHEISLTLTILTPLVLLFLVARPWLVELLYTSEFDVIIPFITFGILHTIFRVPSVIMAYTIVSQGNGLVYLIVESLDSIFGLAVCIAGYTFYGLSGLGVAFIIWYAGYLALTWIVAGIKYDVRVKRGGVAALIVSVAVTFASAALVCTAPTYIYIPVLLLAVVPYVLRLKTLLGKGGRRRKR
ncbi:MAG: oligosaccharide flippase family protein [Bacteroidales bacterium]|nr:oligosaccharide flippase family protein [Bacteroidales bacterium]MBD5221937.1 oligosaccharide flippase family protein [Bacteroidales bacterium]